MSSSSLKDLTKKTIFLVALATARRVSELHAIDRMIGFPQGDAVCTLTLGFLAKNENPSQPWPRSFAIKGLLNILGPEEEERSLWPVRALRHYIKRTEKIRGPARNLWCSVKNPARPV